MKAIQKIIEKKMLVYRAKRGDSEAQLTLATHYLLGNDFPKDMAKAEHYYLLSAEGGNLIAQSNLGKMYAVGHGVQEDQHKAFYWLTKAASRGHEEAEKSLADCYFFGKGVTQSYDEAAIRYRKAAVKGSPAAQYQLGISLLRSVAPDLEQAYIWLQKAIDGGHEGALELMKFQPRIIGTRVYRRGEVPGIVQMLFDNRFASEKTSDDPETWQSSCPQCGEPDLMIYPGASRWKCSSCGISGTSCSEQSELNEIAVERRKKETEIRNSKQEKRNYNRNMSQNMRRLSSFMRKINGIEPMDDETAAWWFNRY